MIHLGAKIELGFVGIAEGSSSPNANPNCLGLDLARAILVGSARAYAHRVELVKARRLVKVSSRSDH